MVKSLFFALIALCTCTFAQKERNYVYLFDCTQSMQGYKNKTPDIWNTTKEYLKIELKRLPENISVSVVPFQDKAYDVLQFNTPVQWEKIEQTLDSAVLKVTNTDIAAAWDKGTSLLDNHKENYFYLLTDGENTAGPKVVVDRINSWCAKNKNDLAFYVMLTKFANNSEIEEAIRSCSTKNISMVQANEHPKPFGQFKSNVIKLNLMDLESKALDFSLYGDYELNVTNNDPYFNVVASRISNGQSSISVEPKRPVDELKNTLPKDEEYVFEVSLNSKDIQFSNSQLIVKVFNKEFSILKIRDQEVNLGKASYYDSFLFYGEKPQDTLTVDLSAKFNEKALRENASVSMVFESEDGVKDYTILYNGEPSQGSFQISGEQNKSELSIIFDKNAKEGKRFFKLFPQPGSAQNLELVNSDELSNFELTMRSKYSIDTNPLIIILLILLAIIVALLILWFIIFKKIFYPAIKVRRISLQIGDFYTSKQIKGLRNVILSNKEVPQSFLSKIFTGKRICLVHPAFKEPITFRAGGKKMFVSGSTKGYTNLARSIKAQDEFEFTPADDADNNIKISAN
ncbi:MAG: VWA domain-containing protein [Fibrobacteraceae bacterium]|nr:VWA domain-containing protein [Fibrobacteraceae bacterium]